MSGAFTLEKLLGVPSAVTARSVRMREGRGPGEATGCAVSNGLGSGGVLEA